MKKEKRTNDPGWRKYLFSGIFHFPPLIFHIVVLTIIERAIMTQSGKKKKLQENMYPKVKVRVQKEDADQYAYEKTSLQSLKAFEWLSLNDSSSSDDSPRPVVRLPRSYFPQSPPPSFYRSKVVEDNRDTARATSAPRPRAVLSSPDNDGIMGGRTQPSPGLKNRNPCQNRHTQCKIFPKSTAAEGLAHGKESSELKHDNRARGRVTTAATESRTGAATPRKKIFPSSVQR